MCIVNGGKLGNEVRETLRIHNTMADNVGFLDLDHSEIAHQTGIVLLVLR